MARPPKIDWVAARGDYIADPTLTYYDIAEKYNISVKAVKNNGAKDDWKSARQAVIVRANEKVTEIAATQLAEVNTRHTNTYKNMQALGLAQLNIALRSIQRAQREAEQTGTEVGIKDDRILGQQRLKFLFDGLKIAMDGERITLGLPTTVSVSKNELVAKDGEALFEQVDTNALHRTISQAVAALGQGFIDGDSAESDSAS